MVERYIGREKVHMEVIVINGRAEGGGVFLCRKSWIIVPFLHRKSWIVEQENVYSYFQSISSMSLTKLVKSRIAFHILDEISLSCSRKFLHSQISRWCSVNWKISLFVIFLHNSVFLEFSQSGRVSD